MGKAAKNEILKIRAAYINNIAVGLFIAGFFVPYFAFTVKLVEQHGLFMLGTPEDWKNAAIALAPALLAFVLSQTLRGSAQKILEQIED